MEVAYPSRARQLTLIAHVINHSTCPTLSYQRLHSILLIHWKLNEFYCHVKSQVIPACLQDSMMAREGGT